MCTYVDMRGGTGGDVQVGWCMQGKGVCVCGGEDEADKEPCRRAGADPGPLTGVSGLG